MASVASCYLSVLVPVKDEAPILAEALEEIDRFLASLPEPSEMIAVDDGSRDGSAALLDRLASRLPRLTAVAHGENRGKGAALKTAVLHSTGRFVLMIDGDAAYSLEPATACLTRLEEGCHAIVGNRHDPRSVLRLQTAGLSSAYARMRHALGTIFAALAARVLGPPFLHDPQSGFKCFEGEIARAFFPRVRANGFDFDLELLMLLRESGLTVEESPVEVRYRSAKTTVRLLRDGGLLLSQLWRLRRAAGRARRAAR